MQSIPRLVLSAVRGGSGKTTVALGIVAAWRGQARPVAVFKKGPDFIDAGWLGAAAGRACYNLDPYLMDEGSILRSFRDHTADAQVAVIEGNRGLYDGVDEAGTYSTANLSKALKAPVALIVDCAKSTTTVGAVALGCKQFDPEVDLQAVILNNVSSGRHESVIRKAIERSTGLPVIGAIPRLRENDFPERHMGLTPFHEHPDVAGAIAAAQGLVKKYLDLDSLWNIITSGPQLEIQRFPDDRDERGAGVSDMPRIGVIRDTAFQFYYPDNLEALEREGAHLVEINALRDHVVPDIDALYIGGGFPETHAAELGANQSLSRSLTAAVENGLPVYAECGGFIYLGRTLTVAEKIYPMTGVLPIDFVLEKRPQAHGYTELETVGPNPFFEKGVVFRGHEFHYSRVINAGEAPAMALRMRRGHGIDGVHDGVAYKNVLAAYTHIHAVGTSSWAAGMARAARAYRTRRLCAARDQSV